MTSFETEIKRHKGEYEISGKSREAVELSVDVIQSGIHFSMFPYRSPIVQNMDGIWIQWISFKSI